MKKHLKWTSLCLALLLLALSLAGCSSGKGGDDTVSTITDTDIIPPDESDPAGDVTGGELKGYVRFQTAKGTQIAPVFDIQGTIVKEDISVATITQTLTTIDDCGYTRVYIIVPGDGYPVFSDTRCSAPIASRDGKLKANLLNCGGNILLQYVKIGHKLGLEMIAIYKPYEGGGGLTIPEGETADNSNWYEDVVGGRRVYFDNFITKHPEMRLVRRDNADVTDGKITGIEAVFMLDGVAQLKNKDVRTTYSARTAAEIGTPQVTLYGSKTNYTYQKYEGSFDTSWTVEKRNVYDANGLLKYENASVYVLRITGFDFEEGTDYIAMTFPDAVREKLLTIPFSMISLYSGDTKLTTSVATYARNSIATFGDEPYSKVWGYEEEPKLSGSYPLEKFLSFFTNWGWEFEYAGSGLSGEGWLQGNAYCMAKGKCQYVAGTLCEGYAEVRAHWLDYVKYLSDKCGFDGVEIRLLGHSSFISDPIHYGYNEPIVQKYKERYGVDLSSPGVEVTEEMYVNIMKIRGEFFEMFLKEASDYLHSKNKVFFMHLMAAYADESKWGLYTYSLNELCSAYRPKILLDWKKCVDMSDEISMKDYHYNAYDANYGLPIKKYAYEQGKTVWVHAYYFISEATFRFLSKIDNDPYATGILWYEYTDSRQEETYRELIDTIGFSRETRYS